MKFNLKNATLKTILTWKKITISKVEFKEGHEENHTYNDRRAIAFIATGLFLGDKVSIEWTSFFGKNKSRTFRHLGGIVFSW